MVEHTNLTNHESPGKGLIVLTVFLAVVVIGLVFFVYGNNGPKTDLGISAEIIEIVSDCNNCFDISILTDSVMKDNNLNIKSKESLDYKSDKAMKEIEKYGIKEIPALIIKSKDIKNLGIDSNIFSIGDDVAVFDKSVPYVNLNSGKTEGLVNIIEIQPENCPECSSLSSVKDQFENMGVRFEDYKIVKSGSEEGERLIEENGLAFLPNLLISKNIEKYWWIFPQLQSAFKEKEDYFILNTPVAPYQDVLSQKIKGKVDITYIENKSCEDCFNVTDLKGAFQKIGVYIDDEKHVDVISGEGKNLIKENNITAIPTLILSKEIQDYEGIDDVLLQIGSFEEDGRFVLRNLDVLKVNYQEIKS